MKFTAQQSERINASVKACPQTYEELCALMDMPSATLLRKIETALEYLRGFKFIKVNKTEYKAYIKKSQLLYAKSYLQDAISDIDKLYGQLDD